MPHPPRSTLNAGLSPDRPWPLAGLLAVGLLLAFSSLYSYLLFHTLVELFSIGVAFAILLLVWNAREIQDIGFLRIIALGFGAAAVLDLVHTLAYKGMGIFPGADANLPTQLWLAARYLQALTLLAAPWLARRQLPLGGLAAAYGAVTLLLIMAIFNGYFPDCYVEGQGLTSFKVTSEYLIVVILLAAAVVLHRVRTTLLPTTYRLVQAMALVTAAQELAFTAYVGVYDLANLMGHLLKLLAFYLLYRAVFVTAVRTPFLTLFRDLKASEQSLLASREEIQRQNTELERRVEERTAEIRAAQAALVESEARYRTIFDNVVDAIYVLDLAGHFLAVNDHACRQYGYRREEFLKLHVSAINTPEDAVHVPARLAAVDRDGYAAFEARHQDAQGHPLTVEVRSSKILYNGQPAMLSVLRDVTERQRTEALLRQNEERFRLAFESANTGMCLVDLQGRLLQVNDKMSAIFGYSRQELEGMTVNDLTYPEDLTISPEYISKANQGLVDSATFDKRYRHRDGHLVYGEVASSLVRDHQGQPLYFISQVQDVNARRLAEAHLRASEERFRLVVEHAVDNIWTMGPDQRMRFLSPSIETLVGYSMEEFRELTLEQSLMPDSLKVAVAYFAALEARRAAGLGLADYPFRGEIELRAKDGTGVWTEIVATPLVDAEGRLTELAGVTRDIRERKRYEDAIRQSERRFRLLLDSFSQIAVQGVTPEGTITFWNQANEPLYGYTAAEALGQDLVELIIPPELRTHVRENIRQMANTGVCTPPEEFSLMRKDGTQVTVYADHAIIDIPGSGRELYSIDIDLTGLRQAEEQLRISEERHRLLADHAMDVIWTMGLDGSFRYVSPSIERLRGHTADEVMHMSLEAAFTPASWAIVQAGLATARAKVQAGLPVDFRAELEEVRKDGSIIWTDVRATGIYGSDGHFIELVGVTRDISERKRYERELEAARAAAEVAARARSEFLANMSHEIRTPMNGVLGLAQLLEREPLTPDQRAMVRRLRGAGRTLIGIINDILDFSKIEAGQLRIERHPFALAPLLERLDDLLGDTARGKGPALRFAAPTGLAGGLVGDDLRLEQVLLNLVGNAIKFTAAGEVRVQVEPITLNETEVRLRFEVRDTGVGIAPEVLPTLFTPFTQADGSTTRRFGGTGLGLSIARRLVELMGGIIGAESIPGQGSCFWFELPFARTTDLATTAATPGTPDPAATGPRLTGRRLLVVDDSDINREVVARFLQREGAEAFLAIDGQEALDALRAHPSAFDAVLMDVQMPVMDGLTATRRVRDELGLTALPVIACTAGVLDEERQQALGAGVNDFLAKPVDLEQLVALVRQWVGPRPAAATRPAPAERREDARELPDIPGIDRARAAQTLGRDPAFFVRLLTRFAEDYADAVAQTRRDLAQGERETATRRLHSLRGNAGNLGAIDLMEAARGLEEALDQGAPLLNLEAGLADLDRRLAALLDASAPWRGDALVAAVATAPGAPGEQPLDPAQFEVQLAALREALQGNNAKARIIFKTLAPSLRGVLDETTWQALGVTIRDLRFDAALKVLDEVAAGPSLRGQ